MAQRISVELIDDVDGKRADETVRFSLDGVEYEIDMTKKNAAALRKAFSPWQDHARRVAGRRKTQTPPTRVDVGVDTRAVRAWLSRMATPFRPEAASDPKSSICTAQREIRWCANLVDAAS